MQVHSRFVNNIVQVISAFGGIKATLLNVFAVIGIFINQKLFMGKLIRHLYFIKLREQDDNCCNNRDDP